MRELVFLVLFTVTVVPMLILAILAAPFGESGDVADGYVDWMCNTTNACKEDA